MMWEVLCQALFMLSHLIFIIKANSGLSLLMTAVLPHNFYNLFGKGGNVNLLGKPDLQAEPHHPQRMGLEQVSDTLRKRPIFGLKPCWPDSFTSFHASLHANHSEPPFQNVLFSHTFGPLNLLSPLPKYFLHCMKWDWAF